MRMMILDTEHFLERERYLPHPFLLSLLGPMADNSPDFKCLGLFCRVIFILTLSYLFLFQVSSHDPPCRFGREHQPQHPQDIQGPQAPQAGLGSAQ